MKVVVDDLNGPTLGINSVRPSKHMYVYAGSTGKLFILSRLGRYVHKTDKLGGEYHYGFVNISTTSEVPSHKGTGAKEAIQSALNSGNKVMEFKNLGELIEWKAEKAGLHK